MYTAIPNRYLIASNFQKLAADLSFPAEVWGVASALSEASAAKSAFDLESLTGLGYEQIREAIERLLAKNLVREDLMSWKDFTAAKKRNPGAIKYAPAPARPVPPAPTAQPVARNEYPTPANGVARLGSITPQKTAVSSSSAWIAQKANPSQVASFRSDTIPGGEENASGRLLRPMLEQIERIKGGGVEGQLLVYQVFLRVPYDLLCAEGIKSLHFVDDQTRIQNPQLIAAIVKAAKDVIGIDLA